MDKSKFVTLLIPREEFVKAVNGMNGTSTPDLTANTISTKEAAKLLGCSVSGVSTKCRNGEIKGVLVPGKGRNGTNWRVKLPLNIVQRERIAGKYRMVTRTIAGE